MLIRVPAAAAVLAIGAALSGIAWRLLDAQVEREARARFEMLVADSRSDAQARLRSYYDVLNGLRGLFEAVPGASRVAFHRYVANLEPVSRPAEMRAISFARYVRAELYEYRFTRLADGSGAWWKRQRVRSYLRPLSLDDAELRQFIEGHGWRWVSTAP